jgi:hypothetical protein
MAGMRKVGCAAQLMFRTVPPAPFPGKDHEQRRLLCRSFIILQQDLCNNYQLRSAMSVLARRAGVPVAFLLAVSAIGQTPVNFTGQWRQQTRAGEQQRQLDIQQDGSVLTVKTMVSNSQGSRRLVVTYQIGGPETVYKGLDGDEFHSTLRWDGSALVFDTVEHEGGRKIPETTIWTLSEDRTSLEVKRQSTKSGKKGESLTTYRHQP